MREIPRFFLQIPESLTNCKTVNVTITEMLVLKLLGEGDAYGLELVKRSEGKLKRGSVYVLLQRLDAKGFVRSSRKPRSSDAEGSQRRIYSLTGAGARAYDAYVRLNQDLGGLSFA